MLQVRHGAGWTGVVGGSASGLSVTLLSEGNAAIYQREDVVCRPVTDLPPSELAVVWRANDDREAVRVLVDACCLCATAAAAPGCDVP